MATALTQSRDSRFVIDKNKLCLLLIEQFVKKQPMFYCDILSSFRGENVHERRIGKVNKVIFTFFGETWRLILVKRFFRR